MLEDKRVCATCVCDKWLQKFISEGQFPSMECAYCSRTAPSINLGVLAEQCQLVFANFYEATAGDDKVVIFGHDPDGDQLSFCLEELLGVEGPLIEDLQNLLLECFDVDPGEDPDPYYMRRYSLGGSLSADWDRMSESLRNEARLFNPYAHDILEKVFGPITTDQTYDGFDVFSAVGPGLAVSKFYRARVFQSERALIWAMEHPERELGPLPKGQGRQGRMNTRGISVFYGATTPEIALAEVRPPVGSFVLMGAFNVSHRLRLLNLEELGRITPDPDGSLFDPLTVEQSVRCDFLSTLTDRLTMPVMPEHEESGYLITQAIADFLATHKALDLDGMIFKSAQRSPEQMNLPGRNVVLFHKSSRVLRAEQKYRQGRHAQIKEDDGDGRYWMPELHAREGEPERTVNDWMDRDERELILDLDMGSMEVYEVKGIFFKTFSHEVAYTSFDSSKPSTRKGS